MRTREEQITSYARMCESKPTDYDRALLMSLLEATEHKIEQRVRAEIGRDSERLDWLLSRLHYGIPGFDPSVCGRAPLDRKADLIRAVDAAREMG